MSLLDTTALEQRLESLERAVRDVARLVAGTSAAPADRWLRLTVVAERVGFSKRTVDDMAKRGEFPRHATVIKGAKVWRASDVERWVAERESQP